MEATIGGTKRHLHDLVTNLDPDRFVVEVACPRIRSEHHGDTSFYADLMAAGATVHTIPMLRALRPIEDARAIAQLGQLIRRGRHDVVHTHSTKAGLLGRLAAAALPSARVVHSPHGFYFLNFSSPRQRTFYKTLERMLSWRTHRLIVLSTGERDAAREIIPDRKIRLIPNAFESFTPQSPSEARQILGIAQDAVVVGTTARFTSQKAPFDIVDTFAAIHRSRPDVRFVWINDGELRDHVHARLRSVGLWDATVLPGYLTDVRRLLPAMDAFVHMARWEGIPYAVMEAMTAGVPVVAARAVGTSDLIRHGHTGYLVEPGDVRAAAGLVLNLLTQSDEARTIALAAAAAVRTYHDLTAMIRATEQVYFDLMRRA